MHIRTYMRHAKRKKKDSDTGVDQTSIQLEGMPGKQIDEKRKRKKKKKNDK